MRFWGSRGACIGVALALLATLGQTHAEDVSAPAVTYLRYVERGFSLNVSIPHDREVAFKQEPDLGTGEITRGALPIGSHPKDFIGFALSHSQGKLYFDLNRNLDLTDDPEGVFAADSEESYFLSFSGMRIRLERDGVTRDYVLGATCYGSYFDGFTLASGWTGEVEFNGTPHRFGIADNFDGVVGEGDQFLFESEEIDGVPAELTLDANTFKLSYVFESEDKKTRLALTHAPSTPELGVLNITGEDIDRLVLSGRSAAILEKPGPQVKLPVGDYNAFVRVKGGCTFRPSGVTQVSSETSRELQVGGPLTPTAEISKHGNRLELSYKLVDPHGAEYNPPEGCPASFSIYRDDRLLLSRDFEYG